MHDNTIRAEYLQDPRGSSTLGQGAVYSIRQNDSPEDKSATTMDKGGDRFTPVLHRKLCGVEPELRNRKFYRGGLDQALDTHALQAHLEGLQEAMGRNPEKSLLSARYATQNKVEYVR